jgi:hypothetical protein
LAHFGTVESVQSIDVKHPKDTFARKMLLVASVFLVFGSLIWWASGSVGSTSAVAAKAELVVSSPANKELLAELTQLEVLQIFADAGVTVTSEPSPNSAIRAEQIFDFIDRLQSQRSYVSFFAVSLTNSYEALVNGSADIVPADTDLLKAAVVDSARQSGFPVFAVSVLEAADFSVQYVQADIPNVSKYQPGLKKAAAAMLAAAFFLMICSLFVGYNRPLLLVRLGFTLIRSSLFFIFVSAVATWIVAGSLSSPGAELLFIIFSATTPMYIAFALFVLILGIGIRWLGTSAQVSQPWVSPTERVRSEAWKSEQNVDAGNASTLWMVDGYAPPAPEPDVDDNA